LESLKSINEMKKHSELRINSITLCSSKYYRFTGFWIVISILMILKIC
jgi:hypothetical protein